MRIGQTYSFGIKCMSFDHLAYFLQICYLRGIDVIQISKYSFPVFQRTKGNLGNDKRMLDDLLLK